MDALPADPRGALEQLADRAGTEFPHLVAARALTSRRLGEVRNRLEAAGPTQLFAEDLPRESVVRFGSWGRAELTEFSDDDWLLIVDGDEPEAGAREHLLGWVGDAVGRGAAAPGDQETFGTAVSAASLAQHIGLDDDTNRNLTRRMLLLLESVPAIGEDTWARAVRGVLDAYLDPTADGGDFSPPRFLLNDLIRYWRTIAVDFGAKHRGGDQDERWVLRNAKLRLSRKMLFAGGLVPVLLCRERPADGMGEFLATWFAAPPTDRIAAAFLAAEGPGGLDAGLRTLLAYDAWIGLLADPDRRDALKRLTREARRSDPTWSEVRSLGERLEQGLLALLFQTELAPVAQRFAVF